MKDLKIRLNKRLSKITIFLTSIVFCSCTSTTKNDNLNSLLEENDFTTTPLFDKEKSMKNPVYINSIDLVCYDEIDGIESNNPSQVKYDESIFFYKLSYNTELNKYYFVYSLGDLPNYPNDIEEYNTFGDLSRIDKYNAQYFSLNQMLSENRKFRRMSDSVKILVIDTLINIFYFPFNQQNLKMDNIVKKATNALQLDSFLTAMLKENREMIDTQQYIYHFNYFKRKFNEGNSLCYIVKDRLTLFQYEFDSKNKSFSNYLWSLSLLIIPDYNKHPPKKWN